MAIDGLKNLLTVAIRRAREDDVEALVALQAEVHRLHLANRPDQFKPTERDPMAAGFRSHLSAAHARVWVAELSGQVVGYAVVIHYHRAEQTLFPARQWWDVDQIGVAKAERLKGVGRALLQAIVDDARGAGIAARRGAVLRERYHDRQLRTPRETHHALRYVLNNAHRHRVLTEGLDPLSSAPMFDGWKQSDCCRAPPDESVRPAQTWLLQVGRRRHGLIDLPSNR